MNTKWSIGSVEVLRVPYFDTPLPPESVGLEHSAASLAWAGPWLSDGQPTVGQAFWIVRSADQTIVIDPCGASDDFLRSGPEALDHQVAAFAALDAAGVDPDQVDQVVLSHLDGIGMAALTDGEAADEEHWSPAFARSRLIISQDEYDFISAADHEVMGSAAFGALDAAGVVVPVLPPHELAPGVTLRQSGGHSPGHCCVHIDSGGDRAILLGHLAVSPLHGAGPSPLHLDPDAAWDALLALLDEAHHTQALVMGSLWPTPGAARVAATDPYELTPA